MTAPRAAETSKNRITTIEVPKESRIALIKMTNILPAIAPAVKDSLLGRWFVGETVYDAVGASVTAIK